MATIFVSPGVYTKEQDFTVFASRIGITRLGLVGKTEKGPAFQNIKVSSSEEFLLRFGKTRPDLPLTYVASTFLSQSNDLTVSRVLGKNGFTNSNAWIITAGNSDIDGGVYSASTLAILRSKKSGGSFMYTSETGLTMTVSGTMANPLEDFNLSSTTVHPFSAYTSGLNVSLDETKENYIVKVFGQNPKYFDGDLGLYVEEIYPHFIREAVQREQLTGATTMVFKDTAEYTNYTSDYTHSITPWIVSRVVGGDVNRLFRFHTISDGDSSAQEIKISIANLDIVNYTFDVIIRRFEDTDATAAQTALERFSNVTLDDTASNYIGKVIGTWDEEFPTKSMFVMVEMAARYPSNSLPAGFEGYTLRGTAGTTTRIPGLYYKTTYETGDSIFKTYLGISELGYTALTSTSLGSSRNAVKSIEKDMFVYHGEVTSAATTTTKGFHLENTADSTQFVSGDKVSLTGYVKSLTSSIIDKAKLKFTLVPVGGFDGFDRHKLYEHPYEEFTSVNTDNEDQFKLAIDVFANPEEVDINLFATPGIDFSNNEALVKYALETVENRTDALYIIDAPRLASEAGDGTVEKGTADEVVNTLESTGIDTNYAATYWPWVQIEDTISGKYTYQPATLLAIKAIALTDNTKSPWFAPAGVNRATAGTNIKRTDVKLSKPDRDALYGGRINPIASFVQQGIVILGQKTMQVSKSSLDRVNIRRLLLQVRRLVSAASLTLLFEQNDQTLRDQFLAKVEPILLQIQNQRGLFAFKVVMDDMGDRNEDRNTLVGKIQIKPTPTAEFMDITFQVLDQGANFEDF